MEQGEFARQAPLRYSLLGLWWRYLNYGGQELGGMFIAGMGLFFVAFAALIGWTELSVEVPYWLEGETSQGTITRKWIAAKIRTSVVPTRLAHGGRRGPRQRVAYDFRDTAGKLHQGQGILRGAIWENAQVGDPLSVEYLASDPRRNRPAGPMSPSSVLAPLVMCLVGVAMLYGGTRWLAAGIRSLRRQVRLIRTGRATAGLIDRLQPSGGKSRDAAVECSYRYFVSGNRGEPASVMRGTVSLYPRQARNLKVNDSLLIVFESDQPENHAVDVHHARLENPADLLP